jgi:phage tail-like protein
MILTKNAFVAYLPSVAVSVAVLGTVSVRAQAGGEQRAPSYRFEVTVDGQAHDLGSWSNVTGLDVSWDLAEYRSDGAANVSRTYQPANPKYGTITLSRASSGEIDLVFEWLRLIEESGDTPTMMTTLFDEAGDAVVSWQLENVRPRNFVVGAGNAEGTDTAVETLVIAHEGFVVICHRC